MPVRRVVANEAVAGDRGRAAIERGDAAVRLPIDEARHLLRVLRLRVGAKVRVFNGRGLESVGRVATIERDVVDVALEAGVGVGAPTPRQPAARNWAHRDSVSTVGVARRHGELAESSTRADA